MAEQREYRVVQAEPIRTNGGYQTPFRILTRTKFFNLFWWGWSTLGDYDWTGEYGNFEFQTAEAADFVIEMLKQEAIQDELDKKAFQEMAEKTRKERNLS